MRGWLAFAMFCGATGIAAAQDLVVYDDLARNGFDGAYSFGGGTDLAETGTVFAGSAAIAYTGSDEFNAVSFARAFVADIPASRYHTLRFYVHGGATGGQRLRLYVARDSESQSATVATGLIDRYIVGGGGIRANEWRLVSIPLADFGVQVDYDRFDFQTELGAQPVLYLDEIVLVDTPTIEAATVTVARGTTSVDVPVRYFAGPPDVVGMQFSLGFARGAAVPASGTVAALAGQLAPDGSPSCGGPATTDPTGTEVRGIAVSFSNSRLESGTLCTFTFPLDPAAPNGSYPFAPGGLAPGFNDATPANVPGNFIAGGIIVADGTAPSVSYSPPPPSQIELPGGALGTPVQASINVQPLGGSGVGRVRLACSVGAPFVLPDQDTFEVSAGDDAFDLAIGCTPGTTEATSELDCTETDEPGGDQRVRTWPLRCPAGSSAGFSTDDATANRGGSVGIGIRFIGDGIVHSMAGDLVFDPARLTPSQVTAANGASCFLRPAQNDRIAVNVPAGPQPLPAAETPYCNVVFVLATNAPIDASPLSFASTNCLDDGNATVSCVANGGSVTTSALDSSPRPGSALNLVTVGGQSSVTGTIVAANFGTTAIDVGPCTPEPAEGFSITPAGAFSVPALDFRTITVGCTPLAAGLPPRVSDLSCLVQDTDPPRVVRYRLLCTNGTSQGLVPGGSLSGSGSGAGDEVGTALATTLLPSGEEIMVVGAPFGGTDNGGRAFVLVRPPGAPPAGALQKRGTVIGAWDDAFDSATAHALSATNAIGDKFGSAVAIDAAGQTIAVGAPGGGVGGAGRVFVFNRPSGGWATLDTPDVTIEAPSGVNAQDTVPDEFGAQVAFSADGTLVVGAPLADVGAGAADAGAAYAYAAGGTQPMAIVRSPQVQAGAGFGGAIAGNGDAMAIGAPLENAGGNTDQGAVYVMPAPGAPVEPTRRVTAGAGTIGDKFGQSVAFVNRTLVVGAPGANTATGADAGNATMFTGDAAGGFTERMTLAPPGGAAQQAGAAVATNGDVVLLGAPFAVVEGRSAQGRVFAYDVPESFASAPAASVIDSPAGQAGDRFGAYLAASPRRLLIGVPKDDNELGIGGTTVQVDEGRADPFLFDRIFRGGYE
ncbi:MAG TPA: hypothetical protein VFO79_07600 [Xanthomonadales bacterium]|nr:hypothetical protein [Xanthomonadales bacterium]